MTWIVCGSWHDLDTGRVRLGESSRSVAAKQWVVLGNVAIDRLRTGARVTPIA